MNISEIENCTGCTACINVCPESAISMDKDKMFYMPVIDGTKCIDCSVCVVTCPLSDKKKENAVLSAYAGWSNDTNVVLQSSSGGAFYALASEIISQGGVVFGAVFSEDNKSVVFSDSDGIPLEKIQKSKYVESYLGDTFKKVKKQLNNGRRVLFCATPCQVAGLKKFLSNEDTKNLLTIDFACGGLPSHKIYSDYIDFLEKNINQRLYRWIFDRKHTIGSVMRFL